MSDPTGLYTIFGLGFFASIVLAIMIGLIQAGFDAHRQRRIRESQRRADAARQWIEDEEVIREVQRLTGRY